jgi:hypothetical protein
MTMLTTWSFTSTPIHLHSFVFQFLLGTLGTMIKQASGISANVASMVKLTLQRAVEPLRVVKCRGPHIF